MEKHYIGLEKKLELKDIETKNKVLNITIPKGISSGEKLRLIGQGKLGENGGKNGDLYITINIKDSKDIKLIKDDFYIELPITIYEAMLRNKVRS